MNHIHIKRGILMVLVFILFLGTIIPSAMPVDALQSRISNFSDSYQLCGYGAEDMIAIAMAQLGKTGSQLGYTEEWCCNFVSDCAILAGQTDAIPAFAYCYGLYNAIISAGGKRTTSSPKPGDICFINWDGGSSLRHVEIVYKVEDGMVYTIGGNSGGGYNLYKRSVFLHDPLASKYIVTIVRPNYQVLDTSYITKCSVYPTYCNIRVTTATSLMSQPCAAETDSESAVMASSAASEEFTVRSVVSNTLGQLWYAVEQDGEDLYLKASDTQYIGPAEDLMSVSGVNPPEKLTVGESFSLKGTVKSSVLPLRGVYARVYSGEEIVTSAEDVLNATSYNLRTGSVNRDLKFGSLDAGEYTFVIGGTLTGYYAGEDGSLQRLTVSRQLHNSSFVVDEYICSYTYRGYLAEHPHYGRYKCDVCGDIYTDKSETNYYKDCEICNPKPEEKAPVPLPEDNHLTQGICFHSFLATCSLCAPEE